MGWAITAFQLADSHGIHHRAEQHVGFDLSRVEGHQHPDQVSGGGRPCWRRRSSRPMAAI